MGVDSSMLQQVVFRTASDGKIRFGTEDDYIYLCITAKFATPPPVPHLAETAKRWQALRKEVLREVLPGTDIVITVEAASKDSEFMREVRDSLEKLKYRQP
jgi:CelD/BcsL family acetyltransferase involved in cellulose biosynthesis